MFPPKSFLIKQAWPEEGIRAGDVVLLLPFDVRVGKLIGIHYDGKPYIVRLIKGDVGGSITVRGLSGKDIKIKWGRYVLDGEVFKPARQQTVCIESGFIPHIGRLRCIWSRKAR